MVMEKTMVIQGRNITRADIALIKRLLADNPSWGRRRLSRELCSIWHWHNGKGQIKEQLVASAVVSFDETGFSVEGDGQWLHVAGTSRLTNYGIHPRRGSEAMDDIGILTDFEGRAIHDFWKPYFNYGCEHGLCNAHHLRELIFLYEVQGQSWAKDMIDCLLEIKKAVDETNDGRDNLSAEKIAQFEAHYQEVLDRGYAENPLQEQPSKKKKRGRRKKTKARNLLERLVTQERNVGVHVRLQRSVR